MLQFIKNKRWFIIISVFALTMAGSVYLILGKNSSINLSFINELGTETVEKGAQWKNALDAYKNAENHFNSATNYTITTSGVINASINKQELENITTVDNDGNLYQLIKSTGSFKNIAIECEGRVNSSYSIRRATNFTNGQPQFTDNWETLSATKMSESFGTLPNEGIYLVNKNTVIATPYFSYRMNQDTQAMEYVFVLKLHKLSSVRHYKRRMVAVSELKERPQFEEIFLTVFLDDQGRFKKVNVNEKYQIKMVVQLNAIGTLTDYYDFDTLVPKKGRIQ